MGSPTSVNGSRSSTWQDKLQDHCRAAQILPPVFNIVSDRRGGRTAWSSTVTISGHHIAARYWYDGQYVNNAKEDAAEVALQQLTMPGSPIMAVGRVGVGVGVGGGVWRGVGRGVSG